MVLNLLQKKKSRSICVRLLVNIILTAVLVFNHTATLTAQSVNLQQLVDDQDCQILDQVLKTNQNPDLSFSFHGMDVPSLIYTFWNNSLDASAVLIQNGITLNSLSEWDEQQFSPFTLALETEDILNIYLMLYRDIDLGQELRHPIYGPATLFEYLLEKEILSLEDLRYIKIPETYLSKQGQLLDILRGDNVRALKKMLKIYPTLSSMPLNISLGKNHEDSGLEFHSVMEAAVYYGAIRCVRYLLSLNRNVYLLDIASGAVRHQQTDILRFFIKNMKPSDLPYILQHAYSYKNLEAVKLILPRIRDLKSVSLYNGASIFAYTWATRDMQFVQATMQAYPASPLVRKVYRLVEKNDLPSIQKIVKSNNINKYDLDRDCTLLHLAAFLGRPAISEYLLQSGADPVRDTRDLSSQPAYLAILMGNVTVLEILKKSGAELLHYHMTYTEYDQPLTLVDHAYDSLGSSIAKSLLDSGVDNDVHLLGYGFYSHSLIKAVINDDREFLEYLLFRYNPEYLQCIIPLEYAIRYDRMNILSFFFEKGYNLNNYERLVEYAVKYDHLFAYQFLRNHNPAYNGKRDGYYAAQYDAEKIFQYLLKQGLNVNQTIRQSDVFNISRDTTLLGRAVSAGSVNVARLLLMKGADKNYKDPQGRTLLLQAAEKADELMLDLLLSAGADPNARIHDQAGKMIYYEWRFNMNEKNWSTKRTVLDFAESYRIFYLLRKAGALYSWEIALSEDK